MGRGKKISAETTAAVAGSTSRKLGPGDAERQIQARMADSKRSRPARRRGAAVAQVAPLGTKKPMCW